MTRIILDTNVILNDFFHRNPDFGFQRISDPEQIRQVEEYRHTVHEALLFLSLQKEVQICITTSILARYGALLGDLLVPAETVLEELQYWMSNVQMLEVTVFDLEESLSQMEKAATKMDFDDYLMKHITQKNEVDMIISSVPKSREFYWPVLFFKPEKLKDLTFSASAE
jgi:predicted nucleic acid-binding protein